MDRHAIWVDLPGDEVVTRGRRLYLATAPSYGDAVMAVGLWQAAIAAGRFRLQPIPRWPSAPGKPFDAPILTRLTIRSEADPVVRGYQYADWAEAYVIGWNDRIGRLGYDQMAGTQILTSLGDLRRSHPETRQTSVSAVIGKHSITFVWDREKVADDLEAQPHLYVKHFGHRYFCRSRARSAHGVTFTVRFRTGGGRELEVNHPVERFSSDGVTFIPETLKGI